MGNTDIRSNLFSLKEISDGKTDVYADPLFFNIPIYQRPYVWNADIQVKILMEDLLQAFKAHPEHDFHLGGVLVVKSNESGRYDLIDGQQRFTTLWLLAQELENTNLDKFRMDGKQSRIHFSIRDHFNAYFEGQKVEHDELKHVQTARAKITELLKGVEAATQESFSQFVYEHVKLILTEVPQDTDLNKLFEVINNRGVQLQQHEILKAKLLEKIDDNERAKYAALWNACSDMDNYLEKSMRAAFGMEAKGVAEKLTILDDSEKVLDLYQKKPQEEKAGLCLDKILSGEYEAGDSGSEHHDDIEASDEHTKVSSIVSFPLFLLHVLRVYLYEQEKKGQSISPPTDEKLDVRKHVDAKKLIRFFDESLLKSFDDKDDRAKRFVELLWKLRWRFDKHVVKWVEQDDSSEKELMIGTITKSDNYLSRTFNEETVDARTMLQSMLYHSQELITQHWLTPLLYKMSETDDETALFKHLQGIDNRVIWAKGEGDLAERMWNALNGFEDNKPDWKVLLQPLGTSFPHYWFYKLEFVLWYNWYKNKSESLLQDVNEAKLKSYRTRSKNSVEHVSAQTEKSGFSTKDHVFSKDKFGNLALVSRESNSSYSHNTYQVKRKMFDDKNQCESLKLALIYAHDSWGDDEAKEHHLKMMKVLCDYWSTVRHSLTHDGLQFS